MEDIKTLVRVALGKEKADLVITGGNLVNVYTGELLEDHSVSVKGDRIAFVGRDASHTIGDRTLVIDASGKVLAPGFIDGHFHIYVCLEEQIKHSLLQGTTTLFMELTELFSMAGYEGVTALLDAAKGQPVKFFGLAPSPYPPPAFLKAERAHIPEEEADNFLAREDVVALGETLWTYVIDEDDEVIGMIRKAINRNRRLEGHCSGAKGDKLVAFIASGMSSCHESIRIQEAVDKLRLGMYVMIREGWIRQDLENLSGIVGSGVDRRRLILVTDGLDAEYIHRYGHMAHIVQKAIDLGFPPIEAIRMTTLNVAEHFGLDNLIGGIAPGRYADILILPSLSKIACEYVVSSGQVVVRNGEAVVELGELNYPEILRTTIRVPRKFGPEDFAISAGGRSGEVTVRAMKLITEVITEESQIRLPIQNNSIVADLQQDALKVSLIERKRNTGRIVSGFIQGIGLKSGACACSYTWESGSPVVVVGTNEIDMASAANRLVELQGGLTVSRNGAIVAEVPMPIGGFMTRGAVSEAADAFIRVRRALNEMGASLTNPFLTLQTIPGTFLPFFRITLDGFADVKNKRLLSLIVE
ncbi:MAG: adenine deaminase C-terminal domain-containing protein [Dehalococcoidia bacterium]